MNWLPRIRSWWKALTHREQTSAEASAELQFHIDTRTEELIRNGTAPEEAARQARTELGQPATQGEKYRQAIGLGPFDELTGDIRYGLRGLLKNPGFATVAILSLALGIGATTSMFSLIYAVLLHPVPYADWQRLAYPIYLNDDQPSSPERWFELTWPQYQQLLKSNSIEDAVGTADTLSEITGRDIPQGGSTLLRHGKHRQLLFASPLCSGATFNSRMPKPPASRPPSFSATTSGYAITTATATF